MQQVYNWSALRSGSAITIDHSTGKLTGISVIQCEGGLLVATRNDGEKFQLAFCQAPAIAASAPHSSRAGTMDAPNGTICATIDGLVIMAGFNKTSDALECANNEIERRAKLDNGFTTKQETDGTWTGFYNGKAVKREIRTMAEALAWCHAAEAPTA